MRVSIAMGTYNGARFIREQLDSFAAQTRLPDELVVTDDASTDATLEIVEEFARSALFNVQVHRNPERLGFARNFEEAISRCSGEVILLSDQDDVWLPEKIDAMISEFTIDEQAMVIVHDAYLTDEKLAWHGQSALGNVAKAFASEASFAYGCCIGLRGAWARFIFPQPRLSAPLSHDTWIAETARVFGACRLIRTPLINYRRHRSTVTDWALAQPRSNIFGTILRHVFGRSAPADLIQLVEVDAALAQRMAEKGDRIPSLNGRRATDWRDLLDRRRKQVEQRIAIISVPRWRRWPSVLRFWLAGGYSTASGWKSAAKDLLRP